MHQVTSLLTVYCILKRVFCKYSLPMVLFLTITAGIILTIGDIVLKQWVRNSSSLFYAGGIFLYLISMNLLAYSYKYENIAVASLLMVIFNILTLTFVGYFFFPRKHHALWNNWHCSWYSLSQFSWNWKIKKSSKKTPVLLAGRVNLYIIILYFLRTIQYFS